MGKQQGLRILVGLFALVAGAGLALIVFYPESAQFQARVYASPGGSKMPYRLYAPPHYDARNKYPLVVWLHSYDAIDNDNLKQISGYNRLGTHVWTTPQNRENFPAFVLAPQSAGQYWTAPLPKQPATQDQLVFEIIAALQKEFSIDADRIYLAGQSMGGFGVWALLARRPDFFAAGIVLCGPAIPEKAGRMEVARRIAHIPVWVFHGEKDDRVPVTNGREMIEALRKAGGQPRYSEYADVGHRVWTKAFAEDDLVPWLFAQKRSASPLPPSSKSSK